MPWVLRRSVVRDVTRPPRLSDETCCNTTPPTPPSPRGLPLASVALTAQLVSWDTEAQRRAGATRATCRGRMRGKAANRRRQGRQRLHRTARAACVLADSGPAAPALSSPCTMRTERMREGMEHSMLEHKHSGAYAAASLHKGFQDLRSQRGGTRHLPRRPAHGLPWSACAQGQGACRQVLLHKPLPSSAS